MQDFDIIRAERENSDRSFKLGGETFVFNAYVHPDWFIELWDAPSDKEMLATVDRLFVERFLEPGQGDKWKKMRAKGKDDPAEKPVSITDIIRVVNHIQQVATGRPTVPSSGSSTSSSTTGTGSTAASPSAVSI